MLLEGQCSWMSVFYISHLGMHQKAKDFRSVLRHHSLREGTLKQCQVRAQLKVGKITDFENQCGGTKFSIRAQHRGGVCLVPLVSHCIPQVAFSRTWDNKTFINSSKICLFYTSLHLNCGLEDRKPHCILFLLLDITCAIFFV